jgi:ribose-phosphate pyrophosphokinase
LAAAPLEELTVTNTIFTPETRRFEKLRILSVAPLLSRAIEYTHSNESISSLFD